MNKKLLSVLKDRCKDFGLSDKAIESLCELGSNGLTDESSEEDITNKADSLVPFAKAMQGEVTRKTKKSQEQPKEKQSTEEGKEGGEKGGGGEEVPAWAKAMQETLTALKTENDSLKAEKQKSERKSTIAAKAKELGIPDYLMKRVSFADDADITAELTAYKQELVTNNLLPKSATEQISTREASMKSDAEAWAKSLPNK